MTPIASPQLAERAVLLDRCPRRPEHRAPRRHPWPRHGNGNTAALTFRPISTLPTTTGGTLSFYVHLRCCRSPQSELRRPGRLASPATYPCRCGGGRRLKTTAKKGLKLLTSLRDGSNEMVCCWGGCGCKELDGGGSTAMRFSDDRARMASNRNGGRRKQAVEGEVFIQNLTAPASSTSCLVTCCYPHDQLIRGSLEFYRQTSAVERLRNKDEFSFESQCTTPFSLNPRLWLQVSPNFTYEHWNRPKAKL